MAAGLTILTLILAFTVVPSTALAKVNEAKLNEANKAAATFVQRYKGAFASGKPPRQSDPQVRALLDRILDASAFGREALAPSELSKAQRLINNAVAIFSAYSGAGASSQGARGMGEEQAKRNIVEFAPEIGQCMDFLARAQGVLADSILTWPAQASPAAGEKSGAKPDIAQVQERMAEGFKGILQIVTGFGADESMSDWQLARLAVLNELAPKVAKAIPFPNALGLRLLARTRMRSITNAAVRDALETFAVAIAKREEEKAPQRTR